MALNPFNVREPRQFFHVVACANFAQGSVTLARVAYSSTPFYIEALVPLVMALGILVGLQITMAVFRSKVERAVA